MSDPQQDGVDPPVSARPLDWALLGRYAVLIALCDLIPLPIVDLWVANALRRRMVRAIGRSHGHTLTPEAVAGLGNAPLGCMGCLVAIVLWPVMKLLKTLSVVFQVKGIADTFSEVMHRGLLIEEAFEAEWLPAEPERVRVAMDQAIRHVDTRPIERTLRGEMRDRRHELTQVISESVRVVRQRVASRPTEALADAADADRLGPGVDAASRVMVATLKGSGLVPELVAWFRAEMGEVPVVEAKVAGPIEPELVEADLPESPVLALLAPIEDAVEVGEPKKSG